MGVMTTAFYFWVDPTDIAPIINTNKHALEILQGFIKKDNKLYTKISDGRRTYEFVVGTLKRVLYTEQTGRYFMVKGMLKERIWEIEDRDNDISIKKMLQPLTNINSGVGYLSTHTKFYMGWKPTIPILPEWDIFMLRIKHEKSLNSIKENIN